MKKYVLNAALLLLASSQVVGWAQAPATKAADTKAAEKPAAAKVEGKVTDDKKADEKKEGKKSDDKKPGNRLPSNYGKLGLTDTQRTKIYAVQDKHETEIDDLNDKLQAAKAKRDSEIEGVLTADQKKMLKDLTSAKQDKAAKGDKEADAKDKDKADTKDKTEAKDKK